MIRSLAPLVTLLEMISLVPMFDLFTLEEPNQSPLKKRTYTDKDPEETHVYARMIEEELELALMRLKQN